jgi:hypothetical protein
MLPAFKIISEEGYNPSERRNKIPAKKEVKNNFRG